MHSYIHISRLTTEQSFPRCAFRRPSPNAVCHHLASCPTNGSANVCQHVASCPTNGSANQPATKCDQRSRRDQPSREQPSRMAFLQYLFRHKYSSPTAARHHLRGAALARVPPAAGKFNSRGRFAWSVALPGSCARALIPGIDGVFTIF